MAVKSRTPYTSKGIVGTVKSGHSDMSILRSMCSGTKKHKTYDMKQAPMKGNEAKAEKRREKKRLLRLKKKQAQ
ncbi:MAG: hypothetical protein J5691_01020 [Bacilli bacterium]|nr:hypothetical protein [Bacilli bacterium]